MRAALILVAAIAGAMIPAALHADDPRDPSMRSAEARARDRAIIRQLNRNELAQVRRRDARYAQQARASDRAMADYAQRRAQHDRDMAAWRRAVAACRAGDYSACDR